MGETREGNKQEDRERKDKGQWTMDNGMMYMCVYVQAWVISFSVSLATFCKCVCVLLSFQSMVQHYACSMHTMHATTHRSKNKSESRHHALGTCTCFLEVGGSCLFYFLLFLLVLVCAPSHLHFPFIIVHCILFFALLFFSTNPFGPRHEFVRLCPLAAFMQPRWITVCVHVNVQVQTNKLSAVSLSFFFFVLTPPHAIDRL